MKILQLIQKPQLRGAEIFACQLSARLAEQGHEVVVVTLFQGREALPYQGKLVHLNLAGRRVLDIKGWRTLASVIKNERPDVVQANAGDTLKYAVFSKIVFGWKAKIIFRNASTVSQYIKDPLTRIFNKWLYRYTDKVISVSDATCRDLVRLFPEINRKITVIPVGIDLKELKPVVKRPEHIVHVGGFTFEKNHEGLIRIFKRITGRVAGATLTLVGDGPLRPSIEKLADVPQLKGKISFAGFVSNAMPYIQEASVVILPSIIEGLPAVILEAFYCQVPVVAYDIGGTGDAIDDGCTGRLIAKGDEESFAKAVEEILTRPAAYEHWTANAYKLVRQKFSNEVIAGDFAQQYQMALK